MQREDSQNKTASGSCPHCRKSIKPKMNEFEVGSEYTCPHCKEVFWIINVTVEGEDIILATSRFEWI